MTAAADPDLWWLAGHARLEHSVTINDRLTVTPSFDAGVTRYRQASFDTLIASDVQQYDGNAKLKIKF